jgi:hypothetical protein
VITGTNPFGTQPLGSPVDIGKQYTYKGTSWDLNPSEGLSKGAFDIVNDVDHVTNFYVKQAGQGDTSNFIALKEIAGAAGNASFEPIQTIAMYLTAAAQDVGTLIITSRTPGALINLSADEPQPSASIEYDKDKGWSGPTSIFSTLESDDKIYDTMRAAAQ